MSGNVPIVFPVIPIRDNWQPRAHVVTNVTNNTQAVVTTSDDHLYTDGMAVRVFVPKSYGMTIDYIESSVTVVSPTEFQTDIDTSALLPFVTPVFPTRFTNAQVIPVDGSFRNIAPIGI